MGGCNYCCVPRINCKTIAVVVALLFGTAIGILGFFNLFASLIAGFVALGFGVIFLGVLLYAALSDNGNQRGCLCRHISQLLTGIIGTLIFSVATVTLFLIVGPILSALLIGITVFFLALTFGTFICYIICLANCSRFGDNSD